MKIIAFTEARQVDVIRKILDHCGLWQEQTARGPPQTREPDPDFAEHLRREQQEQAELPWDP